MWEAFLRGDFDQSLSAFHPDVEWDGTNLPDGTISRGHEAIIEHTARWSETWDHWAVEVEDLVDAGDDVVVFIRERGRSKTRIDVDERHSEVYTLRDGMIVRRQGFSDAGQALEAVGLSE